MKFRTKAAVFLVALALTLIGFNFIASPAVIDLLKLNDNDGFEIVSDQLVKDTTPHTITVKG